MAKILRGDIFWADLNPTQGHEQAGIRPVVVLSHNIFNESFNIAIVMALTSQPQKAPFPISLKIPSSKLPKQSWVKISQIRTISTDRLGKKIGKINLEFLNKAIEGLNEIIN